MWPSHAANFGRPHPQARLLASRRSPFQRPGGAGWGDGSHGMGGEGGMVRSRKFSADELQLLLLALLEQQPRHGYELISELASLSNGFYSPSPGVIYPALSFLEDLGYASVRAQGNRKQYHLTDAGRGHLDTHRDRAEYLLAGLRHMARKMAWMRQAWKNDSEAADELVAATGWLREFVEARRALKTALTRCADAPADEQRRIVDILRRATDEILNGKSCTES